MKVRIRQIRSTRFYYPDLSVVCQSNEGRESFQDLPIVIVEVVSDSTRRVNEYEKREAYLSINSLMVYIPMEQNAAKTLVYRRTDEGFVREVYFGMDAVIHLKEIECSLSLTEVYANVEFIATTNEDE
jgi:Uma2 family endonuclease